MPGTRRDILTRELATAREDAVRLTRAALMVPPGDLAGAAEAAEAASLALSRLAAFSRLLLQDNG